MSNLSTITSKQRQLSSELSFDEQLSNLKSLLKNPPQNSRVCEFTPELAEYILENLNINNRPRKSKKIIEYKSDMQAGNWSLTGETIKFGTDGHLKDGQNRLAACMQAQTPFTTHAIFGIDPETFHHMDTGKVRAADDVLAIMGVKNAKKIALTVKFLISYGKGKVDTQGGVSNQEIKDAYLTKFDPELLQLSVSWANKVYNQTRYPQGQIASTYYMAVKAGKQDKIEEFYTCLMTQTGTANSSPVKLQKHLTTMRGNRVHITSRDYSVLLSRAFYCFVNKKRMTKDMFHVTLADKCIPMEA